MRYFLTLFILIFLISCQEKENSEPTLQEVEVAPESNDSILIFKNGEIWETIPHPKVAIKFVDKQDSLIHN